MKKKNEPEELNQGLKITGYSAWLTVIAGVLIIGAIVIWACIANYEDTVQGAGQCEDGVLTCYFCVSDIGYLKEGMDISVNGKNCKIEKIEGQMYKAEELPNNILYYSQGSSWYQKVIASCNLEDGTYMVKSQVGTVKPISFMGGND